MSKDNKINYLQKLTLRNRFSYDIQEVVYPLILALSAEESVAFFDLSFEQHYQVRQWIMQKISDDMAILITKSHFELINYLVTLVNLKGFTKRSTCGFVLMTLITNAPMAIQRDTIGVLLASAYASVRICAYKKLKKGWDNYFEDAVLTGWFQKADQLCLKLIALYFPATIIKENFNELKDAWSSYDLASIFIKYPEELKELRPGLREVNEISYVYLIYKLNDKLSVAEAKDIIAKNYLEQRIGLLLWCLGKMKLWDAIVYFNDNYRKEIMRHRLSDFHPEVISALLKKDEL